MTEAPQHCDVCHQLVTFHRVPIIGVVAQSCGCGVSVPMRRYVEQPVDIPADILGPPPPEFTPSICRSCGKDYLRSARNKKDVCGPVCRERARNAVRRAGRLDHRVLCRSCGLKRGNATLDDTGRCGRCRKLERYRARRLNRIHQRGLCAEPQR